MKNIYIETTKGHFEFTGEYLRDREKPNWHYYRTNKNQILHFRKEHMVYVIESDIQNAEDQDALL